eukprot:Phypoly_transcript_06232.p1 GENE.Phypoly_transcript_06232~~Phypoly_transcript_06232.p1  ORF type:complete len:274 (+),score=36.14 Phypoly_transcript_06232:495-1316(+)
MPKSFLDQYFSEDLMILSWSANTWWHKPTSTVHPFPSLKLQLENINLANCANEIEKCAINEETAELYRSHGFSNKINIMRGPSILMHALFENSAKSISQFEAMCTAFEAVPDVILWAPGIPYHMLLAQGGYEIQGQESHREMAWILEEGVTKNHKEDKKARKILLTRAWNEAVRITEMHPLVLILYPALAQRCLAKQKLEKNPFRGIKLLKEFIATCFTMETTTFKGLMIAAFRLAEIFEIQGMIEEAKKYYNLALTISYPFKYAIEEEEYKT